MWVYLNEGHLAHTGRVVATGCVQSKWAQTGHVWNHGVFEVPIAYGNDVKYFLPPSDALTEEVYAAFKATPEHERYPKRWR